MNGSSGKTTRRRLLAGLGASLAIVACERSEQSTAARAATAVPADSPSPNDVTSAAADTRSGGLRPSLSEAAQTPSFRRRLRSVSSADIVPDVPRDAIPPLNSPDYQSSGEAAEWLQPDHLVLGFERGGDARAYPLRIMNWHEIVNDRIGDLDVVVTYCPLCRTGLVFDRNLPGVGLLTFGNTGALYESAMVMYDHETDSQWWQAAGEAITGPLKGAYLDLMPAITATWSDWLTLWPQSRVLSRNTGYERDYQHDAFDGYSKLDSEPGFPVSTLDHRLQPKAVVLGVEADDGPVAYSLTAMGPWAALNDELDGRPIVVFSGRSNAGAIFEATVDDKRLEFAVVDEVFVDVDTGSTWDLAGRATAGPFAGRRLVSVPSYASFWFSWATVWPGSKIKPEPVSSRVAESGSVSRRTDATATGVISDAKSPPVGSAGVSAARGPDDRFQLDPGDRPVADDLANLTVSNALSVQPLSRQGLGTAGAAAFSGSTGLMALGSKTGMLSVTDTFAGEEILRWKAHDQKIDGIAFSSDGSMLLTGGKDRMAKLWDAKTGHELFTFEHKFPVSSVAFGTQDNVVASGNWGGQIGIWDVSTGGARVLLDVGKNVVSTLAFSPDETRIAIGTNFWPVWVWDARTGLLLRKFEGHTRLVSGVAFSPDGRLLASSSLDGTVRLWNLESGKQVILIEDDALNIISVAFNPDGTILATGRLDGNVGLWEAETGISLGALRGHADGVLAVSFTPNGNVLASVDSSGAIWFWGVTAGSS